MKKGLEMLMTAVFILAVVLGGGVTVIAADDQFIGRELSVEGVGVINIDLEVQTDRDCNGLKLSDRVYTPSGGYRGASYVQYNSALEMGMYNESENVTMDMEYSQTINVENAKGKFTSKNYLIGSATGYKYAGDINQDVLTYSDNALSETMISGSIEGEITLGMKVVDPVTRVIVIKDVSNFVGSFNYNYSTYGEYASYPASGDEEYLGCP
jgi:hypothetical protein